MTPSTNRHNAAVIADVEEVVSWALLHLPSEVWQLVNAVDTDIERLIPSLVAVEELLVYVWLAGRGQQRRQHVLVAYDSVKHRASLDLAGPAEESRNAPTTLPVRILLAPEGTIVAIGPCF